MGPGDEGIWCVHINAYKWNGGTTGDVTSSAGELDQRNEEKLAQQTPDLFTYNNVGSLIVRCSLGSGVAPLITSHR